MCRRQRPKSCHGPISSKQPSLNDALGNGTTKSGSNEYFTPSPSHSGHIPCGLLKLKSCGLGGSNDNPQCVQAYADENKTSPSRALARPARFDFLSVSLSLVFSVSPSLCLSVSSSDGATEGGSEGETDSSATIKFPFPNFSASSTASANLARTSALITNRSTTTSMSCRICRSRDRSSESCTS